MAMFFHVVGRGGSGKSTLILAYAQHFQRQGKRCAGHDPEVFISRAEALEYAPRADVYFIEHYDMTTVDQLPGETVIQLDRAPVEGDADVRRRYYGQMVQAGRDQCV